MNMPLPQLDSSRTTRKRSKETIIEYEEIIQKKRIAILDLELEIKRKELENRNLENEELQLKLRLLRRSSENQFLLNLGD